MTMPRDIALREPITKILSAHQLQHVRRQIEGGICDIAKESPNERTHAWLESLGNAYMNRLLANQPDHEYAFVSDATSDSEISMYIDAILTEEGDHAGKILVEKMIATVHTAFDQVSGPRR